MGHEKFQIMRTVNKKVLEQANLFGRTTSSLDLDVHCGRDCQILTRYYEAFMLSKSVKLIQMQETFTKIQSFSRGSSKLCRFMDLIQDYTIAKFARACTYSAW